MDDYLETFIINDLKTLYILENHYKYEKIDLPIFKSERYNSLKKEHVYRMQNNLDYALSITDRSFA